MLNSIIIPGGANRDRTYDLLVANQSLSQLSYRPIVIIYYIENCLQVFFVQHHITPQHLNHLLRILYQI